MSHKPRVLIHRTTLSIRWGDMDVMGHVNNTVYFRYIEQARLEWFEAMGIAVTPHALTPVLINAHCTFLVPLTYPGTIEVNLYAEPPGRSSLNTLAEIRMAGEERLYAEGGGKVVWMNPDTGRSAPIPPEVLARLPKFE